MKNLFATILLLSSILIISPVIAGAGHSHTHGPVSSDEAINRASKKVNYLAKAGKIDTSWSKVKKAASVEKKTFSKGTEWVITFKNDRLSDSSKRTLYMFFSLDGHYIAANYTGN